MTPNSAKLVDKFNFADFINTNKYNMHEIYLDFLLEDENNRTLAQKQFFPSILKETTGIRDTKIQLKLDLTSRCKNDFTNTFFEILVNAPAIFIYIQINHPELQYYTLSKNGFMQNEPIQVVYLAFENPGCSINLQDEHFSVSTLNEFMWLLLLLLLASSRMSYLHLQINSLIMCFIFSDTRWDCLVSIFSTNLCMNK